ncbi:MAG: hypothetical protein V1913_05125 [Fibrobacterota bacterium]
MITRMRRLSIILHHAGKEHFLAGLQQLGAVHVTAESADAAPHLEAEFAGQRELLSVLDRIKTMPASPSGASPAFRAAETVARFTDLDKKSEALALERARLEKERRLTLPWGGFDPDTIRALKSRGLSIRLFETVPKRFKSLALPVNALYILSNAPDRVRFALIERKAPVPVPLDETPLPASPVSAVDAELLRLDREQAEACLAMEALAAGVPALEREAVARAEALDYQRVRAGLTVRADGRLLLLSGYCPASREQALRAFLLGHVCHAEFSDPLPGDRVPVELVNNAFARLFEPITRIFSLPDYHEYDPTPFFAPFFTLFVGLCIGDVGYGGVVLLAGLIASFRAPERFRPVFRLMTMLGGASIVCGVLLNGFFGHAIFGGPGIPAGSAYFASGAQLFSPLSSVQKGAETFFPAMNLAIVLGFLQVLLGMVLRAVSKIRNRGWVFGIQPLSYLVIILGGLVWGAHTDFMRLGIGGFSVGAFAVGPWLLMIPKSAAQAVTIAGLLLFLLFNNPDKRLVMRVSLLGAWEFYGFATGLLGDILSYLRLFILGLSGGLLGGVFNYIAFLPVTENGVIHWNTPLIAVSILLLLTGHALNFCLMLIGSFVHPLRLTFVEFYKNLDFKGGGAGYSPFRLKREPVKS